MNYPVYAGHITKGIGVTVLLGEKCLTATKFIPQEEDDDDGWASGWDPTSTAGA